MMIPFIEKCSQRFAKGLGEFFRHLSDVLLNAAQVLSEIFQVLGMKKLLPFSGEIRELPMQ